MPSRSDATVDYALIGGGIMSATLAILLTELDPDASVHVYERLLEPAQESSDPWRNAGTGHAALCELNYTPERPDGSIDITKAIAINEQFKASRELWDFLAGAGLLPADTPFVSPVPHMNLVIGAENVDYLRRRHAALTAHPNFADMEYTTDPAVIAEWAPLLMEGRDGADPVAATRSPEGTDVDFGSLTRAMFEAAKQRGVVVHTSVEVSAVRRSSRGWDLKVRDSRWNPLGERSRARARFVFVGAGGGALRLLQSTRIPEVRGFAGFPISGQFLRTFDPALVARHRAKVYGKADGGAPPMSVPHLDTRVVDGRTALMFGPFAGFSVKFLRFGSPLDAFRTIRPANLLPMLAVARDNLGLVKYLVTELLATPSAKLRSLQKFFPGAERAGWTLITAGQRVQMIKPDPKRTGALQFGTEVITSADGSVAGLLGASPGASTAAYAMAQVVERCFGADRPEWVERLREIMPSLARADADPHDAKPAGPV
ncbi:malate dehydrogenase (quinone) [Litorihabitans aurantiacus]|uniref:Probable malate:quinone oxidoreductase n=1 Tax=Litorihabitans aurantiacus TaxID=1930061 RepID=A0AA37XCV3_9MICO|nr:malate dehydrogenase (quinone) [Litorihabitans aurantiacus]GMA30345.1 putative malate:quinone oxidoreductase [Litorihabitans aurantiacus]